MQTRTYGDLFKLASALIGTGGELSTGEQDQLSHFINRRFSEIFNASPSWPRYITVGEPRTIVQGQVVPTTEDSYYVYGAGTTEANGLYVRNGNSVDTNPKYTLYNDDEAVYQITSTAGSIWAIQEVASGDILYSSIGGAIVPEGIWTVEIDGKSPAPIVQALSNIGEFVRIHNTQPLLNRSAREYGVLCIHPAGAHILNVESTTNDTAWVTYKK